MNSTSPLEQPAAMRASGSPKVLWAVIGVLAIAVAALGGVLLHRQGQETAAPASTPVAAAATAPAPDDFKPEAMPPAPAMPPPAVGGYAGAAGTAPRSMAAVPQAAPAPANSTTVAAAEPAPAMPAAPACAVCGRVESVRPVQRQQKTTGVGAVTGGVVGGLVGNQFGHGNGRVATTVLGAVGGGFAGNAIEKHVRTVTVYEVGVRMDDGRLRTVETKTAPPIGKPVTLQRGVLRPADGHK
ncbi:glycine zipper 2TM domain-containing protein [Variovorax guangxiensis]|uniref:Glycine zipper 2TM domain-containing protein n=1 Tax=Variovorax guangxiensis TaxID=1775474 RepID=A0A3S0XCW3_9BURK|nr:glycine zipper 2TM domain-containing protein [Variovorax guangxiensis]RUR66824.1 glycine zipper 2TM domain-containing protein [Variovorax guangxiensis]